MKLYDGRGLLDIICGEHPNCTDCPFIDTRSRNHSRIEFRCLAHFNDEMQFFKTNIHMQIRRTDDQITAGKDAKK